MAIRGVLLASSNRRPGPRTTVKNTRNQPKSADLTSPTGNAQNEIRQSIAATHARAAPGWACQLPIGWDLQPCRYPGSSRPLLDYHVKCHFSGSSGGRFGPKTAQTESPVTIFDCFRETLQEFDQRSFARPKRTVLHGCLRLFAALIAAHIEVLPKKLSEC